MESKKNEIAVRASMPKIDYEYANISLLAHYITTTPGLVDSNEPCKLVTMPSKKASVTIDLKTDEGDLKTDEGIELSRNITPYDATVMDAVYSLFINGCVIFTPEMVARIMSGKLKGRISAKKVASVSKSLNKLRHIDITIDLTDEFVKTGGVLEDGKRIKMTSYLLPLDVYNAVILDNGKMVKTKEEENKEEQDTFFAGYRFIKKPVLYTYAESRDEIEQIPPSLLTSPKMSDNDDNMSLKWYLVRRIGRIKRAKNKNIIKNVIYYDQEEKQGAFKDLGFFEEDFVNWRDKKNKIHAAFVNVLDGYKSEKYIKDYKVLYEGKAPIGVEIQVYPKY